MRNLFILLFLLSRPVSAQTSDTSQLKKDISFASYLIGTEQYSDAVYFIGQLGYERCDHSIADTLNYLKGWAFYNTKQLDSSSFYLLKVDRNARIGKKAHFFAAYNHTFLGDRTGSRIILQQIPIHDTVGQYNELRTFELAGIALLERQFDTYTTLRLSLKHSYYSLSESEESLDKYYDKLSSYRAKSKLLAGTMSAIIPGSGKIYAGKIGEGISALFTNAILATMTLENYHKAGPGSIRTILFGSLFTVFYLGNIYGSIVSVQVSTNEFNSYNDKQILFHLHIPLRTIFN